jgi:hypothetical protein
MRKIKYDVVCIGLVRICHGYNTVDDLGLLESIGSWIGAAPCRMGFNLRIDEGMPDIYSPRAGVLDNVEFLRKKRARSYASHLTENCSTFTAASSTTRPPRTMGPWRCPRILHQSVGHLRRHHGRWERGSGRRPGCPRLGRGIPS